MSRLADLFDRERRLAQQERALTDMRAELEQLRAQNESMRTAMRRCITCDYRLDAKARDREASAAEGTTTPV